MAAAYGVPLGGALFALEVMRGKLALRFVLSALFASLIATGGFLALPAIRAFDAKCMLRRLTLSKQRRFTMPPLADNGICSSCCFSFRR